MVELEVVVDRLNDAVRRDWRTMQALIMHRLVVTPAMIEHPTMIVAPDNDEAPTSFSLGLLGVLNGLIRDDSVDNTLIESMVDDAGELIGFRIRGSDAPVTDMRTLPLQDLCIGQPYRVTDAVGNMWQGTYRGPGERGQPQGLHLLMADNSTVLIYFHDVRKVIDA